MKQTRNKAAAASRPAGGFGLASGASTFGGFGTSQTRSTLSYLAEPPSFTAVSDPNIVVAFKNILKKDSTTKTKGLEELLAHARAHPFDKDGGVEEAILDIWAQLYPRVSVDNSRRVRELAHNLQFALMQSARKRMEKYIPRVVGAWLAGLYDRDRAVARAASDGLASFLNTPEKVQGFWKKCHSQILDYAVDGIRETQDTLSDERSTTKDDAEAKYYRVVAGSLSLVLSLLQKIPDAEVAKLQSQYDDFFAEETTWKSITFNEISARKMACELLCAGLDRKLLRADDAKVTQAFVTGGLRTNQAGSAAEYVVALAKLTELNPGIWASSGEKKKAPLSRLQAFIAKGSQGSAARFWEHLGRLLSLIPTEGITLENASALLTSLKSGVTNREEPRTNAPLAWKCFMNTARRLLAALGGEDKLMFGKEHLLQLFEQFLFSAPGRPGPIPSGADPIPILVGSYVIASTTDAHLASALGEEWDRLAMVFCGKITASLPEVSKEYESSQTSIGEEGKRWFGLVGGIHRAISGSEGDIPDYTTNPSLKVLSQCISLLESRNFKPFGAVRVIEYELGASSPLFKGEDRKIISSFLLSAAEGDISGIVKLASSKNLVACVNAMAELPETDGDYSQPWKAWVSAILQLPDIGPSKDALASLLSHKKVAVLAKDVKNLRHAIYEKTLETAQGKADFWVVAQNAIAHGALDDSSCLALAKDLLALLDKKPEHPEHVLSALKLVAKSRPGLLSTDEELHVALVAHLLSLSEINDTTVSSETTQLRALLDQTSDGKLPIVDIIHSNLDRADTQSLEYVPTTLPQVLQRPWKILTFDSIETIASQIEAATDVPPEDIFPNTNVWMEQLGILLRIPINPALSITSNVGGAVALVKESSGQAMPSLQRDRKGRSIPVRMAMYLNKLVEGDFGFSKLPPQFQVELFYLLWATLQVASDQINSMAQTGPWASFNNPQSIQEAQDMIDSSRKHIVTEVLAGDSNPESVPTQLLDLLLQKSADLDPQGLYTSRVLCEMLQIIVESRGLHSNLEDRLLKTEMLKATPNTVLSAAAIIAGVGQTAQSSKQVNNFCNRLVSDIAGASPGADKTHMSLVLLSLCGQIYEKGELPVANNRIVFAVRQITSWLDSAEDLSPGFSAEICRALSQLLPCMKDVYGSYWEKTLTFCNALWVKAKECPVADALPFIHSSLKLVKIIESLEDPNDDLADALNEFSEQKSKALLGLLKLPRDTKDSVPLEIVDAMICREVEALPMRHIPEISELFPLVASESRGAQTAAFTLLRRAIPPYQEQKSVDVLLDNTDASLPDELLSLLLDAPTLEDYSDEALATFPGPVRSYLLAWKLVFDAYAASSHKVRADLTLNLDGEASFGPMLEFMFDVLGHSAAHPLKLEKENLGREQIREYDVKLADAEEDEKNMHWLLVHIYYLTLKYMPGLFRQWYMNCRSRQTKIAVETWTTKYISPLTIGDTLDEVQKWADEQDPPSGDDKQLSVRISRSAREVVAGYEVEESEATIAIKIPTNYPMEVITVEDVRRMAASQLKWDNWLLATQGVIAFSNGSIIDGLQVFKRNIVAALKGQEECAICYSVIASDKRLPDRRCPTCKHLFHRTCLFKWFQTSDQNTCPLCRNPMTYDTRPQKGRYVGDDAI